MVFVAAAVAAVLAAAVAVADGNGCPVIEPDVVLLTRVPKCGSTALREMMRKAAGRTAYTHTKLPYKSDAFIPLPDADAAEIALAHNRTFDHHRLYTDFVARGLPKPTYISVVRHPVERLESAHYMWEYERRKSGKTSGPLQDFDTCLREGSGHFCQFPKGHTDKASVMGAYFCGFEPECRNGTYAYAAARKNIVDSYAVIGVSEDMYGTLGLLQKVMPGVFGKLRANEALRKQNETPGRKRTPISPEMRAMLEKELAAEIDLYNWILSRFERQKGTCRVKTRVKKQRPKRRRRRVK